MKCPKCKKEMQRVSKADRRMIRLKCVNPKCSQISIIRQTTVVVQVDTASISSG